MLCYAIPLCYCCLYIRPASPAPAPAPTTSATPAPAPVATPTPAPVPVTSTAATPAPAPSSTAAAVPPAGSTGGGAYQSAASTLVMGSAYEETIASLMGLGFSHSMVSTSPSP
jgi:cell division septation protein DedD